ncbi:MAG: YraN family protein [Candidatus Poribacteria bacterium]|nr:YraN family protein [Candidatus Poribacteria bacterium]
MSHSRIKIGKIGEALAVEHLKAKGYEIREKNFRTRTGEIDLIVQQGKRIVFVEVKTRRSLKFGTPQAAVTPTKQRQISRIALDYLQAHNLLDAPCRFDVIAILLSPKSEPIELRQIENAFEFCAEG